MDSSDSPGKSPIQANASGDYSTAISAGNDVHFEGRSGETPAKAMASDTPANRVILFVAANPHDGDRLRGDEEAREIDTELKSGRCGGRFLLHTVWAARTDTLERALLDYEPAILHFSGHGLRSGILLEESRNCSRRISLGGLGQLLQQFQQTLRCLVLNCCDSIIHAEALAEHVDRVIGTPGKLNDQIAIRFSVAFYRALAARKSRSIEDAFEFALASLAIHGHALSDGERPHLFSGQESPADIIL